MEPSKDLNKKSKKFGDQTLKGHPDMIKNVGRGVQNLNEGKLTGLFKRT